MTPLMAESLTVLDHPLVREADQFATAYHALKGQLYGGRPYCVHTRAVAALLAAHGCRPVVVAAGHLHDTLEDTDATREELVVRFGAEVAQHVDDVSSSDYLGMPRAVRAAQEAARLAAVVADSKDIKCSDVIVNTSTIVQSNPRFARVYIPEKRALLDSLCGARPSLLEAAREAVQRAETALAELSSRPPRRP